jgi:hypothetical protein
MKVVGVVVLMLLTPAVAAADDFERLLLPLVVADLPGAYGTIWHTDLVVRNEGDVPLEIFSSECIFRCVTTTCSVPICPGFVATPPHAPLEEDLVQHEIGVIGNPGSLLHIPRGAGRNVVVSLRLFERSRMSNEFGVEIPVIREVDLFTNVLWLPDVPMPSGARTHVRVYGVESPSGEARVRVRTYRGEGDLPAFDAAFDLQAGSSTLATPKPGEYIERKASYLLLLLPPELTTNAMPLRVRVDPITPGLKFWAMASVTSNDTQHVTLVTPQ